MKVLVAADAAEAKMGSNFRGWARSVVLVACFAVILLCLVVVRPGAEISQALSSSDGDARLLKKKNKSAARCNDGTYSKHTLQLAYELPFAGLFNKHNRGRQKYEASSVIIVEDDAYAICDASWAITKFNSDFQPFSPDNIQIGDANRGDDDSGYEAIFHDNGTFYVVRESVEITEQTRRKAQSSYHAIIEELALHGRDYEVLASCPSEYEFEGTSKGFEGAVAIHDLDDEVVVLALCEANFCSEARQHVVGNGRVIAMKKVVRDGSCMWATIREVDLPPSVEFHDYSDISLDDKGRVAITSQEDSKVWIGELRGRNEKGLWDVDALVFDDTYAKSYDFPKSEMCETVYCNIEGIQWMGEHMLLAVSDRMKSKGGQHFR